MTWDKCVGIGGIDDAEAVALSSSEAAIVNRVRSFRLPLILHRLTRLSLHTSYRKNARMAKKRVDRKKRTEETKVRWAKPSSW